MFVDRQYLTIDQTMATFDHDGEVARIHLTGKRGLVANIYMGSWVYEPSECVIRYFDLAEKSQEFHVKGTLVDAIHAFIGLANSDLASVD